MWAPHAIFICALLILARSQDCPPSIESTNGDDIVITLDCERDVSVAALRDLLVNAPASQTALESGISQVTAALAAETSAQAQTAALVATQQSTLVAVQTTVASLSTSLDISNSLATAALASVAASTATAISSNREALNATKSDLAALGAQMNSLATLAAVSTLRSTVLSQAALIENQRLQIVELRCKVGLGVDVCGVCNGNNDTCCPGNHYYGTGSDGTFLTPSDVILQDWVPGARPAGLGVAYRVVPPSVGVTTLSCFGGCTFTGLAAGDQVLLVSLQGALGDTRDVGNRAFHKVVSASNLLVLAEPVALTFGGSVAANQIVLVQRVPQFDSLTVTGTLRAAPWDGGSTRADGTTASGLVVFRVKNTLTGGTVSANEAGFRGGCGSSSGYCYPGCNGEGIDQASRALTGVANTGGGAGGNLGGSWCISAPPIDHAPLGGGGGSYGTSVGSLRGISGTTYGNSSLKTVFLGGGGGGSTSYRHVSGSGYGSAGANGAGIVMVYAKVIQGTALNAVGGSSGPKYIHGGTGGGGAGGSVLLQCDTCVYSASVAGGTANNDFYSNGRGTDGGVGRLVVHKGLDLQLCNNPNGIFQCAAFPTLPNYCAAITAS